MIATRITQAFGLTTPILNAGMAMIARPQLAAAVSNAGGLGMLGVDVLPPDAMRGMIRATRALTSRPLGVDMLARRATDEHFAVAAEEQVALVVMFWGLPTAQQVARLKAAGTAFWMQVGSVAEALEARDIGAEAIIVQGAEGGGHNRAEAATFALLRAVRNAVAPLPVIAAGGICDGATMAAALALGAEAVWCGTRFLASEEADAHAGYKARVVTARVGDTLRTSLFGPEWPDAPARVIANAATREWAGREAEALARHAGEMVATLHTPAGDVPLPRFSAYLPSTAVEGDLDQLCLTAGECTGNISEILPARRIVEEMTRDCLACIAQLAASVTLGGPSPAAPRPVPSNNTAGDPVMRYLTLACAMFGAAFILCLSLMPAQAQFLRFVATTGSDANNCATPAAACRTFQAAHERALPGTKIVALDSGDFFALTITKSIAIVARGVDATLFTGARTKVVINAGVDDVIYLDGLRLGRNDIVAGNSGIEFNSGARLHVRNCTIRNFGDAGISIRTAGTSRTYISDCTIATNRHGVIVQSPGRAANVVHLDRVTIEGNAGAGIKAVGSAAVVGVSNSSIVNNKRGFVTDLGARTVSFGNNVVIGNHTAADPTETVVMK